MWDNVRSALISIWSNKLRSLLTLLGVVIGVSSVVSLVALGQGLKKDVSALIQGFGTNVVVLVSGKIDGKNAQQNPADLINGDILTLQDAQSARTIPGVEQVTPMSLVSGALKLDNKMTHAVIFGTNPNVLEAMQVLSLDKGRMFSAASEKGVIVLGPGAVTALFGDSNPIGKSIKLGSDDFTVIGTLKKAKAASLFSSSLDDSSIIPFDEATRLNKNQVKINRIITKAADSADPKSIRDRLHQVILANHGGEENFSALTQDDLLGLFDQFLNIATAMVSAIAGISLVVGGIGIMNIMLVTVTERTREIGLRKAVGATKGAILLQFLTEAVVITFIGGLLGLGISYLTALGIAAHYPLHPEFTWQVLAVTVGISVVIGVVFGIWPAMRAASKDPIEALRYE